MQSDLHHAEYWTASIFNRYPFPNPVTLAAQFANADNR